MSKKNKRGRQKQKVFLNDTAYAFSQRRKTLLMTDQEIADTVAHASDYDPDGRRGLAILDAAIDCCNDIEQLYKTLYQQMLVATVEPKKRMLERMHAA